MNYCAGLSRFFWKTITTFRHICAVEGLYINKFYTILSRQFLEQYAEIDPLRFSTPFRQKIKAMASEDTVLYSIIAFIVLENAVEIFLSLRQVNHHC